jgi:hypothetical protein
MGAKLGDRISAAARRSVDTGKPALIKASDSGWCAVIGRAYGPIMRTPMVAFSANMALAAALVALQEERTISVRLAAGP